MKNDDYRPISKFTAHFLIYLLIILSVIVNYFKNGSKNTLSIDIFEMTIIYIGVLFFYKFLQIIYEQIKKYLLKK